MATKQRSRSRRSTSSRSSAPYVAPVLDPTWQNPYAPSVQERAAHQLALRRFARRRQLPQGVAVAAVVAALVALAVVSPWSVLGAVFVAGLYAWYLHRYLRDFENRALTLERALRDSFTLTGTPHDVARLATVVDRLSATFGVDGVTPYIVADAGYNAALVPGEDGLSLFVTDALMRDFELIELEAVVAHCLARQRVGALGRQAVAAALSLPEAAARRLAGSDVAYRADEVAAAAIRYPLGLAAALRRCAMQSVPSDSFLHDRRYESWRWVFFNVAAGRDAVDGGDLDDPLVRARALEEW
ncbi:MAG: hypothetical protein ACP5PB_07355 [Acidimicrobiales bacterium]